MPVPSTPPSGPPADPDADLIDLVGLEREAVARVRDAAARVRDATGRSRGRERTAATVTAEAALDRLLAARDRAAAAAERRLAAMDRQRAREYLERAYRDDLTGALQRKAGADQLAHAVDRAHRLDEPLVVAFLDVDHLKQVNDEQGHAAGDELLRAVGRALEHGLRSYDVVVRHGGDEFISALPGLRLPDARRRLDQVATLLAAERPGATISVGAVELQPGETLDAVVVRADREMYGSRSRRPRTSLTERP